MLKFKTLKFKTVSLGLTSLIIVTLLGLSQPAFSTSLHKDKGAGICLNCGSLSQKAQTLGINTSKILGCLGRQADKTARNANHRSNPTTPTNNNSASSHVNSVSTNVSPGGFSINAPAHVNVGAGGFNGHAAAPSGGSHAASAPASTSNAPTSASASNTASKPTTITTPLGLSVHPATTGFGTVNGHIFIF